MTATVAILEAIGLGPDSEVVISPTGEIVLLARDAHSTVQANMQRLDSGLPVYSCERWLRLRFTGGVGLGVRFWIANYDPAPGWSVTYGVTDTYRKPSTSASDIAVIPITTTDPGAGQPNIAAIVESYSPWLVLQARWVADDDTPLQPSELQFRFAYNEG